MKTANSVSRVFVLCLAFAAIAHADDTPQPGFKFWAAQLPGAQVVIPNAINNNGVEIGTYEDESGVYHGYIFDGKNLTTLDDPNGSGTNPQGIPFNNEAEVVGYYYNANGTLVGFVYDTATQQFRDIHGPTGAVAVAPGGINDQGWIAGYYFDSNYFSHGFLHQGTTYTTLDPPNSFATFAFGVNNSGDVAITWLGGNSLYEGAIYDYQAKTYRIVNVPGATLGTEGSYINNQGDVTLWWFDSSFRVRGAVCTDCSGKPTYYTFDYPSAYQTYVNGINDSRVFAGGFEAQQYVPDLGYVGALAISQ